MTSDHDRTDAGDRSTTDQSAAGFEATSSETDRERPPLPSVLTCPRCGSPTSATVVRGPDDRVTVPCGCHLTDHEQGGR